MYIAPSAKGVTKRMHCFSRQESVNRFWKPLCDASTKKRVCIHFHIVTRTFAEFGIMVGVFPGEVLGTENVHGFIFKADFFPPLLCKVSSRL